MKYIWIVLNAEDATQQLKTWMDEGHISGVNELSQGIQAYTNKLKSFAQERGGSVVLSMQERIVMQLPTSAANEFEKIIEGYSETLGAPIAVGIGLNYNEAIKASNKARATGKTELFDPSIDDDWEASLSETKRPALAYRKPYNGRVTDKIPKTPTVEEEAKMNQSSIQQMLSELGLPELMEAQQQQMESMQEQQQQMEAEQQMAEQQAMQEGQEGQEGQEPQVAAEQEEPEMSRAPGTLLDALMGHTDEGQEEETPQLLEQDAGLIEQAVGQVQEVTEEGQQMAQEIEPEVSEAEESAEENDDDPFTDKIGHTLNMVHDKLPEIMSLRSQDPDGFKDTISAIVRLINAAKKKNVRKADELIQDITVLAKTKQLNLPVGTRRGRMVKIRLPDGTEKWRSMASGRVTSNADGQPISVRVANEEALDQ